MPLSEEERKVRQREKSLKHYREKIRPDPVKMSARNEYSKRYYREHIKCDDDRYGELKRKNLERYHNGKSGESENI